METIKLTAPDTGEEIEFYVLEQTCINGMNYILATEEEEEDGDAYILKEVSAENEDVIYEFVDDEIEFDAIARVFAEMMDEDVELER
ncbi:MAG: DUF1292 domain-containing protein [Eubacterium sp.]|nr:DUF1292 domain-containing protein [Eubacterium sp.]